MDSRIVQTTQNVTLVGAGPVNTGIIEEAFTLAPTLIAVDGGTEIVQKCGKIPDAVLGDLDSVSSATLDTLPTDRVYRLPDQNETDFQKALKAISAPLIVGLGFLGGRLDHQMAVLGHLANQTRPLVLVGQDDLVFRVPQTLRLNLPDGMRLSVHPVPSATVTMSGVRWPLQSTAMQFDGFNSQSNEVAGGVTELSAEGRALCFLPTDALRSVVDAFAQLPSSSEY